MNDPNQKETLLRSPYEMAEASLPAEVAARSVQDDLLLDGTPALNLAGFATTYMEEEVERVMLKNLVNNLAAICTLSG